jgi:hypothetical protein
MRAIKTETAKIIASVVETTGGEKKASLDDVCARVGPLRDQK